MALPTPSPTQVQSLTDLKAVADAGVTGAAEKEAAIQGAIDKQQDVEDFQKSTFDALNNDVIGKYEKERRWINGSDISSPIVETDLQDFVNQDETKRLWNNGDFSPLRIAEFDGGPLVVLEAEPELDQFPPQDTVLDRLQNGIAGQILIEVGANIQDPLTASTIQIIILDNTIAININDLLFISGGGFACVAKVTGASAGGSCSGEDNPPQLTEAACLLDNGTWSTADTVDIELLIPPSGTIPALSDVGQKQWNGFTNTERTNKVATDTDFQDLIDTLLSELQTLLNLRKTAVQNQITEFDGNVDDNLDAQAKVDANASVTSITNFLGITPPSTIDISDTGITAINNEKTTREAQANQRVIDIGAAILFGEAGTKSYFDARFETSEGRARLNNGSINLLKKLTDSKTNIGIGATEAQGLSDRYDALIP